MNMHYMGSYMGNYCVLDTVLKPLHKLFHFYLSP